MRSAPLLKRHVIQSARDAAEALDRHGVLSAPAALPSRAVCSAFLDAGPARSAHAAFLHAGWLHQSTSFASGEMAPNPKKDPDGGAVFVQTTCEPVVEPHRMTQEDGVHVTIKEPTSRFYLCVRGCIFGLCGGVAVQVGQVVYEKRQAQKSSSSGTGTGSGTQSGTGSGDASGTGTASQATGSGSSEM